MDPKTNQGRRSAIKTLLGTASLLAVGAQAQDFPTKPIRMLVGIAPGGGLDAGARRVALKLSEELGQSIVVENRPGAGGSIAANAVATANPDGYTLLYAASTLLVTPSVIKNLPFDPVKSFTPVGGVCADALMLVVANDVPARTTAELIALLKANPGKYSYGSTGIASVHQLSMELFKTQAGVYAVHIPYKGAAPILPDLISGVLPMAMISAGSAVPQIRAGKFRAIAHSRPGRLSIAPEVPAIANTLAGFDMASSQFIVAPAGTPARVVARLNAALKKVLSTDEMSAFFLKQGSILEALDSSALSERVRVDGAKWQGIAKGAGIVPE